MTEQQAAELLVSVTRTDPYMAECVLCGRCPCEPGSDFCTECSVDEFGDRCDPYAWNFGRCYLCRDFKDHEHCIGVPCQCPCPVPDQSRHAPDRAVALAKLTPHERRILGV